MELIVRRPAVNERELLSEGVIDLSVGLVGDNWLARGSSRGVDHAADPDAQITVINARLATLVAGYWRDGFSDRSNPGSAGSAWAPGSAWFPGSPGSAGDDRRALAGDQLYLDFDISVTNLPVGSHLRLGSAIIEVTAHPHAGCIKFMNRFGVEAIRFVNSPRGRQMRLRGLNARVIAGGRIRLGDPVSKVAAGTSQSPRGPSPRA